MAAYAALVSLMNIIDDLHRHPRPPISLHKKQAQLLTQKVAFLQQFLEAYNPQIGYSTEADPLESRIADAAYAAEDAIESHIVDQITGKKISLGGLYRALKMVIEEMVVIETDAMEIIQNQHQLHIKSTPLDSLRSSSITQRSSMVGVDDLKFQMMDKLTSDRRDLQIIPIVGMGGSGKTTLAINIYQNCLIKKHFHICAWATISQEYSIRDMLIEVLCQLNQNVGHDLSEDALGEKMYKHLFGRKYLIVMDDVWSIRAWDGVKKFLPENQNGSRVVITTRLSNLASELDSTRLQMKLLDEVNSWDLLCKTVFGEKGCPFELEEIGKKIAKSCKGLPLTIVVVGGFLAKSEHTREFWESIEENLNSVVNLEDDERCLKILHMSYKQMPVYLKPCFLYMGVFPEDDVIRISKLIKLWVAEGFLKPASGKSLEEIAKAYVKDLADRNLILIHELGFTGNIKFCKIHDLLRDLCLREAQKERFYTVTARPTTPQETVNAQRRIVVSDTTPKNEAINVSSSMLQARSLIRDEEGAIPLLSLRLLRILASRRFYFPDLDVEFPENVHQLVNLRYLYVSTQAVLEFHSSSWLFWNLQTLIVQVIPLRSNVTAPIDIWYMPHIRHIQFDSLELEDPPNDHDDIVLEDLQTLGTIWEFKFSEQVVKRIPNIKKLITIYRTLDDSYCLSNLDCLDKLESFTCNFFQKMDPSGPVSVDRLINFPHSLNKLSLRIDHSQCWEEILDKIGSLPLLQKFKLCGGCFKENKWKTTEGQFCSLKFLLVCYCKGLQVWTTESSHFPCLEQLVLEGLDELSEIPLDFAEISTLRIIEVKHCCDSVVVSAKRILEEQEELYGEEAALRVQVWLSNRNDKALWSWASPNFHIR